MTPGPGSAVLDKRRPTDIFLQPGEHFVSGASLRLCTLLGSCVAITLWQPQLRIGAMSHSLLAQRGTNRAGGAPDGRYTDEALALMLDALAARGVDGTACEAKIFGGGDMFPGQRVAGTASVGQRNGEAARGLLAAHGIAVSREHLFGAGHRQIIFDVATGDVWVRQIRSRAEWPETAPGEASA